MIYFGANFLVPLILAEATSAEIESFIRGLDARQFTVTSRGDDL